MPHTTYYAPRPRLRWLTAPFVLADRAFRPSRPGRISDGAIEAAQIARTAIGLAATAWMVYAYPMQQSVSAVAKDKFLEILLSAGVLVVAGPALLVLFATAARAPARSLYLRRLKGPMTGFGALFISVAILYVLLQNDGGTQMSLQFGPFGQFVFLLAALAAVLFAVPFGLTAAFLCVHYVFRTADVHEVLPPLISPLLVWATLGLQLLEDAPASAAPPGIRLLFLIGPALSVTALSLWELRRLRVRFGRTIRGALHRGRRPQQW
ncbi:hypothetical protein [Streptomyces sp. NBC_01304]|uniref:hypothetical protein n=1 Tax=Streptomyces sp. NBC_01304 TaxID=2903818 RepID=UPI002E15D0CB|nr:hypothetical protein OG430_47870 [Streptomyces sp. NBC_01304]